LPVEIDGYGSNNFFINQLDIAILIHAFEEEFPVDFPVELPNARAQDQVFWAPILTPARGNHGPCRGHSASMKSTFQSRRTCSLFVNVRAT
jgi:hypothetical protein